MSTTPESIKENDDSNRAEPVVIPTSDINEEIEEEVEE